MDDAGDFILDSSGLVSIIPHNSALYPARLELFCWNHRLTNASWLCIGGLPDERRQILTSQSNRLVKLYE